MLICGDGDFGYATALANALCGRAELHATSFETEAECAARYPHAPERVERLRARGTRVDFGVDARALRETFPTAAAWERVVFNIPQAPPASKARNQIQRHRALLRDVCASAAEVLAPCGELWLTLLAGQGGTPLDPVQRLVGNTWQLQLQAAHVASSICITWPRADAPQEREQTHHVNLSRLAT